VRAVPVRSCLHLKTAANAIAGDTLLVNPRWVSREDLAGFEIVEIDAEREPFAANVLRLGDGGVVPEAHERTIALLERRGLRVERVAFEQLARAEAGPTCASLVFAITSPA